ncbi:MAG: hypothetical protein IAE77_03890 [Prosthecobacter sp.]|jgi:hypothetical protein|uniref:hypothetical protein n=1 Tax=Prosthecobacter sp. TaxID=1965333 RepID=UPI0019D89C45|nr:hypothetical protein [Prosthecobacter sp.]MBE2282586.1 hypothetical protein [Prosthecobacter sp.]
MQPDSQAAALAGAAPSGLTLGLFAVIAIVSIICWIKVLIALFKNAGVGLGILGIICAIFAFVWGWVKSGSLGLRGTMITWTLCLVGSFVVQGKMAADMMSNPEFQKAIKEAQQQQAAPSAPAPAPAPAPATNN